MTWLTIILYQLRCKAHNYILTYLNSLWQGFDICCAVLKYYNKINSTIMLGHNGIIEHDIQFPCSLILVN